MTKDIDVELWRKELRSWIYKGIRRAASNWPQHRFKLKRLEYTEEKQGFDYTLAVNGHEISERLNLYSLSTPESLSHYVQVQVHNSFKFKLTSLGLLT